VRGLREKGDNLGRVSGKMRGWIKLAYGNAAVTTNDGDDDVGCDTGFPNYFGHKGGRTDDIQGGHTEDPGSNSKSWLKVLKSYIYRLGS
jgi:hypothetical protein